MANTAIETASKETIVSAMQSASPLLYGATLNANSLQNYNADQLRKFKLPEFQDMLEGEATIAPTQQSGAPARFSQTPVKTVRSNLIDRGQTVLAGTATAADIQSIESLAFLTGGFKFNMNGVIDNDQERAALEKFMAELGKDEINLSAIYNNNVQTRVEQALDAQARAEITSQVSAGLAYSNFLDEDALANMSPEARTNAIASAYNNMLIEHRDDPNVNIYDLQTRAFVDPENGNWELSTQAADILRDLNKSAIAPPQLGTDIAANTTASITRAQNYINLVNDENIDVTGIRDNITVDAAQAILSKEINLADIEPNMINSMAAQGQLALPTSDEEIKGLLGEDGFENYSLRFAEADRGAEDYGLSREQFLANQLIVVNPEKYETFLAEYNTSDVSLNQYRIQEVVETEVTNNPLNIPAQNTGFDALVNDTGVAAAAVAQTPEGEAVFAGDQGLSGIIDYMKNELAPYGTNKISMYDALTAKYDAALTLRGDHTERHTAGSTMPSESEARFLDTLLNDGAEDVMYDLTNPADVEKLLVGLAAYEQDKAGTLTIDQETQDYVTAYVNDARFTGYQDSITRVAYGNDIKDLNTQITGVSVAEVTPQPAEPVAAEPLPQSRMVLEDAEVAAFYNAQPEISAENLLRNATPAYASIIPTPSMLSSNPGIQSTISLKDQFGASAAPITSTPPAGLDIDRPANINTINPELAATGTDGLSLPNFGNKEPAALNQSQMSADFKPF